MLPLEDEIDSLLGTPGHECYHRGALIRPFPFEALPKLSRDHIGIARSLRRHLGPGATAALQRWGRECLGLDGQGIAVRLTAVWDPPRSQLMERVRRASLYPFAGARGEEVVLALDGSLVGALARAMLRNPSEGAATPTPGEEGLVGFGLAWLIACVAPAGAWRVMEPGSTALDELADARVVEIDVLVGCRRSLAWLVLPRAVTSALSPAPTELDRVARVTQWLTPQATAEVVRLRVPLRCFAGIGVGDIVIAPGCPSASERMHVELRVGQGSFPARIEGTRLTIDGPYRGGERRMEAESGQDGTALQDNATIADQLEVELIVEMGRVELRAAELLQLGCGDVITLNRPVNGALDLRVSGRLIGRGELVDVEGEAGIRMVEVFD